MIFEISSPLFVFFTYHSAQCSSLRLLAFAIHEFEYATGATSPCHFFFWTPTAASLYFLCTSFTVRFNSGGKQLLLKKIYFVSRSPGIFGGVLPSKVASSTYNLLLHTYSLTMDPIPLASLLFFIMILISFLSIHAYSPTSHIIPPSFSQDSCIPAMSGRRLLTCC